MGSSGHGAGYQHRGGWILQVGLETNEGAAANRVVQEQVRVVTRREDVRRIIIEGVNDTSDDAPLVEIVGNPEVVLRMG